ncbi:hypothetical protein MASR2M70_16390 [Bacillota bacterium]
MMKETHKSFEALGKSLGHDLPKEDPQSKSQSPSKGASAFNLPEDYVSYAEGVIKSIGRPSRNPRDEGKLEFGLTTSQIRNILTLINQAYNEVVMDKSERLSDEIHSRLLYVKVRLLYESGRTQAVDEFVKKAKIIDYLDGVQGGGSRDKFMRFAKYMEALVAYHKFYGGN